MKNKFVKLLAISAVIFGSVSCKDEVAAIGQKAPDIAAYDLQGKEVKLDDWKGTRLLTFWSETCGRCVAELKEFEKLAEANPNKVQLIAIMWMEIKWIPKPWSPNVSLRYRLSKTN